MAMALTANMFSEIISHLKTDDNQVRTHEKRSQGRVGLRGTLEVVPCSTDGQMKRAIVVRVRDLSINGIGFMSSESFKSASQIIARFPRTNQPPLSVVYEIRYCRSVSTDLNSIGASFVRLLPDAAGNVAKIPRLVPAGAN